MNKNAFPEQLAVPQRPDLEVLSVEPAKAVTITNEQLPWVNSPNLEVPTVMVHPAEGQAFRYGSVVKGNGTVEKLASKVDEKMSLASERIMFKGLQAIFQNKQLPPNIDLVPGTETAWPVYKTTKRGPDAPRLYFTWFNSDAGPVVIKLGLVRHKHQQQLLSLIHPSEGASRTYGKFS